jgi:hypothetical protein
MITKFFFFKFQLQTLFVEFLRAPNSGEIGRKSPFRLSPASPRRPPFRVAGLRASPTFACRPPLASPTFVRRPPLRVAHLCTSPAPVRRPPLCVARPRVSPAFARHPPPCVACLCASSAFSSAFSSSSLSGNYRQFSDVFGMSLEYLRNVFGMSPECF